MNFGASLIRLGQNATFTIARTAKGTLVKGVYAPGTVTSLTCLGLLVPANGRVVELLPEGLQTEEVCVLYSPTLLHAQDSAYDPDTITAPDARVFQVHKVDDWIAVGGYCKAVLTRVVRA